MLAVAAVLVGVATTFGVDGNVGDDLLDNDLVHNTVLDVSAGRNDVAILVAGTGTDADFNDGSDGSDRGGRGGRRRRRRRRRRGRRRG